MSEILTHVRRTRSSFAATWTDAFANPVGGDLLLMTLHIREPTAVSSISFGGVTPELIASSAAEWPGVFVYGIRKANQPAEGQTHDLEVTFSGSTSGAVTLTKLSDILPSVQDSVLSSLTTAVVDNTVSSTGITTSVTAVAHSFLFAALTHREGCPAALNSDGETLTAECFDSPRGAGVALAEVTSAGEHSVSWSWGDDGRRSHIVVAIPRNPPLPETPTGLVVGLTTANSITWGWDG